MMLPLSKSVFLADDDIDDCFLFEDALREIPILTDLTIAHDGEELMQILSHASGNLSGALFLDLNMPLKNGFECLAEIKRNEKFELLDVIILSTSFDHDIAYKLFKTGAKHCILKPSDFNILKAIIHKVLTAADENLLILNSETEKLENLSFHDNRTK